LFKMCGMGKRGTKIKRQLIALGALVVTAAAAAAPAGAASSHPGETVTAVGAQSTERFMGQVLGTDPQYPSFDDRNINVASEQSTPLLSPADPACPDLTYRRPASGSEVVSPRGARAGRDALRDSAPGLYPDATRGAGGGCVDLARSDMAPRQIGPAGDPDTFEYYAYGLDVVTWATTSLRAPITLTLQQLREIYDCAIVDWGTVGGVPGPIQRVLPPVGTSTREVFANAVLDVSISYAFPTGPECPAVFEMTENDARGLSIAPDGLGFDQYIFPYSSARWVGQSINRANPTLDLRNGARPGGIERAATDPVEPGLKTMPIRWDGAAHILNNATVIGGRVVSGVATTFLDPVITAAPGTFSFADVGKSLQGATINDGTVIVSVSFDGSQATIDPSPRATSAADDVRVGIAAVSEENPSVFDPFDRSVYPGVSYVANVVDSTSPSFSTARGIIGFVDVIGGAKSPLCSGAFESEMLSAGILALRAGPSLGGNLAVTCRRIAPAYIPLAITRASVDPVGTEADNGSVYPVISADGRYVAFNSRSTNLVPGDDSDYVHDVFVKDLQTGAIELVSKSTAGDKGQWDSNSPAISADARFVAFTSIANNLVPGDTSPGRDVFLHDRQTAETQRISVNSAGQQASGSYINSVSPSVSADGRYVAFESTATNLASPDVNGQAADIFVRDTLAGTTTLVSVDSGGAQGNAASSGPFISADGRYVGFTSSASNLVPGDANARSDVFVRDLVSGTTTRVSLSSTGGEITGDSWLSHMTPDARRFVFASSAPGIVPGDTNNKFDVFVRDTQAATTIRASVDSAGVEGNNTTAAAAISADGRFVVMQSASSNLVWGDTNNRDDIFVRDLVFGVTVRVSTSAAAIQADQVAWNPGISADGTRVVFHSPATTLVPSDTNGEWDVFAVDLELDWLRRN
jgi:Tol biopolymer transport system component